MTVRLGRLEAMVTGARLVLAGRLDDSSAGGLAALAAQLPAGDIAIDTAGVTFANSNGMREWLRLVRVLRARGRITLERVADVLMTQMNLIPEFTGSVAIASFYAPFACPRCGAEPSSLVDAVAHGDGLRAMQAPRLPCPECGGEMDFAEFPERYLTVFRTGG